MGRIEVIGRNIDMETVSETYKHYHLTARYITEYDLFEVRIIRPHYFERAIGKTAREALDNAKLVIDMKFLSCENG